MAKTSSSKKASSTSSHNKTTKKITKKVTTTVSTFKKVETSTTTSSTAANVAPSSNWKSLQTKINPTPRKVIPDSKAGVKRSKQEQSSKGAKQKDDKADTLEPHHDPSQLWFDDISKEDLEKAYGKSGKKHEYDPTETGKNKVGKYIGIDCEMVGVGPEGTQSALARVSLVNFHGVLILDLYVRPMERVTDFRTAVSGITPRHLASAVEFKDAQKQVAEIIKDKIVVGHAVHNDFKALLLDHPQRLIRDTSRYAPFRAMMMGKTPSLRKLALSILGIKIQDGAHSSVEDARVTILLYKKHKEEWDSSIAVKARRAALKATKSKKAAAN
ncbi:ribonuclease H-like domain-containing protein [Mortierella sp. GBAus27b]|nr:ribonuclease H-like domain-containing protein [Mortierella sp. GBAus27b]